MKLNWISDVSVSALHAADASTRGLPFADAALAEAIAAAAQGLAAEIRAAGLPEGRAWRNLVALAAQFPNNRELTELMVKRCTGGKLSAVAVAAIVGRIEGVEAVFQQRFPRMKEDLALRERPIREQWEARGPGLLHQFAKFTAPELLVEEATVISVHPALGGGGEPHLQQNAVRFEAVLANPDPQLPEFVRLGWLLAQLNCDLPMYSELIHPDRLPHVVRLALLPPILAAGREVEAVPPGEEMLLKAIDAWRITVPPGIDIVPLLTQWWATYEQGRPRWTVALTALDRMLG